MSVRNRVWAAVAMSLVLVACGAEGSAVAPAAAPVETTPASTMAMEDMSHDHGDATREWDGLAVPTLAITVAGDNDAGWTGIIEVTDFVIDPVSATEALPGHGHVHVTVDGQEWSMVYEPNFTIPALEPGPHTIMVSLSTNDHLDYVLNGEPISAMTTVVVEGEVVDADQVIEVTISAGEVAVSPAQPDVQRGDIIEIVVVSDVADQIHVHGYDVVRELEPGVSTTLRFVADIPGVFEVELEMSAKRLFGLTVR